MIDEQSPRTGRGRRAWPVAMAVIAWLLMVIGAVTSGHAQNVDLAQLTPEALIDLAVERAREIEAVDRRIAEIDARLDSLGQAIDAGLLRAQSLDLPSRPAEEEPTSGALPFARSVDAAQSDVAFWAERLAMLERLRELQRRIESDARSRAETALLRAEEASLRDAWLAANAPLRAELVRQIASGDVAAAEVPEVFRRPAEAGAVGEDWRGVAARHRLQAEQAAERRRDAATAIELDRRELALAEDRLGHAIGDEALTERLVQLPDSELPAALDEARFRLRERAEAFATARDGLISARSQLGTAVTTLEADAGTAPGTDGASAPAPAQGPARDRSSLARLRAAERAEASAAERLQNLINRARRLGDVSNSLTGLIAAEANYLETLERVNESRARAAVADDVAEARRALDDRRRALALERQWAAFVVEAEALDNDGLRATFAAAIEERDAAQASVEEAAAATAEARAAAAAAGDAYRTV